MNQISRSTVPIRLGRHLNFLIKFSNAIVLRVILFTIENIYIILYNLNRLHNTVKNVILEIKNYQSKTNSLFFNERSFL